MKKNSNDWFEQTITQTTILIVGKNKKISNLVDPPKLGVAEISTAPQRKSKFRPPPKKNVF